MAKILLVEDDTNLSEIYQARMEAEGYQVVAASDGETALAMAAKEKPDLIISDVMMPKISGFEMLDILRNTDGLKDTPVIMLTALGQSDDKNRAESLGADRYLVKSQVTLEDIVNAAHSLLEGNSAPTAAPMLVNTPSGIEIETGSVFEPAPLSAAPTGPLEPTQAAVPLPVAIEKTDVPTTGVPIADIPAVAVAPIAVSFDDAKRVLDSPAEAIGLGGFQHRQVAAVHVPYVYPAAQDATATVPPTSSPSPAPSASIVPPTPTPALAPALDLPTQAVVFPASTPAAQMPESIVPVVPVMPVVATAPPTAAAIDERVVNNAIDRLLARTPVHGQVLPSSPTSSEVHDDRPLKKVISPISRPPEASLDELLALENARDAKDATNATNLQSVESAQVGALFTPISMPVVTSDVERFDTVIPDQRNDFTQTSQPPISANPPPTAYKPPLDPSSISL